MKLLQKSNQTKSETLNKDTLAKIRAIAHEHSMSYHDAVIHYSRTI